MTALPVTLAIVGKGRSGSTLLDTVLGQVPGIIATGELWHRWGGRPLEAARCGCGASVGACVVWAPVLAAARDKAARRLGRPVDPATVFAWEGAVHRWPRVPRLLRARAATVDRWPALHGLATFAAALYEALAEQTGAAVIVDSSKWPATVTALGLVPDLPVRVLQLVRDPRAVAFSWQRVRDFGPGGAPMPRYGLGFSAASWVASNAVAERVRRRQAAAGMLLTYETLAAEPAATLARLLAFVGKDDAAPPVAVDGTATVASNHTVGGNPVRFRTGPIRIAPDDEWRTAQPKLAAALVGVLTAPWRRRYGY